VKGSLILLEESFLLCYFDFACIRSEPSGLQLLAPEKGSSSKRQTNEEHWSV